MDHIIENLKDSLVKLDVSETQINLSKLIELKVMSKLATLTCGKTCDYSNKKILSEFEKNSRELQNLKRQMPHLIISQGLDLQIAQAFKKIRENEGLWEIKEEQIKKFSYPSTANFPEFDME